MSVYEGSRYTKTRVHVSRAETPILAIRRRMKFNLKDATRYTWTQGDNLDGVAFKFYNNAQLYWAILDANPKYCSEIEIKNGDILVIPSFREVVNALE